MLSEATRRARSLARSEDGAATIMSIFWLTMMLMISGFVLDVSNAYRIRAQLQATADASALAAAGRLPDPEAARDAAIGLSRINMPVAQNGEVILPEMVEIGYYDPDSGAFVADSEPYEAVRVVAARGNGAGLPVPTFLIGLMGKDAWNVAASSVARSRSTARVGGAGLCPGALIISDDTLQMGGNNSLTDGVCVHGRNGVRFGGSSYFTADVRVSSSDPALITIGDVDADSPAGEAEVKVPTPVEIEPRILPRLDAMFAELWETLYDGAAPTYSGDLLPDFVFNSAGYANIVRVDQWWWTVQPGDLQPHTIYLVNHGMQLAGQVDAQNIAIIAKGAIGMGGGQALHFDKVYIFGEGALNFAGSASYGEPDHYCDDGKFDVYMFSKERILLGGSSPSAWAYGLIAAAPSFTPGGSWKSSGGIYVEASETVHIGGNAQIGGCGLELEADIPIVQLKDETLVVTGGSLVR